MRRVHTNQDRLVVTTKKHIIDKQRLKPTKISIPHSLNTSPDSSLCLITADPQRTYKDIVASPAFPTSLGSRIARVIDITHIKQKYKTYEAQRKLFAEHDLFLADDRIITELPKALGKTFYKSTVKRPIPLSMQGAVQKVDGKKVKKSDDVAAAGGKSNIQPQALAAQIERSIACAVVALSPSTTTSIRVGYASWSAQHISENIAAVVSALVEKTIPQKFRGVKAIHIKSPTSMALPIWLADELWMDEKDVITDSAAAETKKVEADRKLMGRKRKAIGGVSEGDSVGSITAVGEAPLSTSSKSKKAKLVESDDGNLDKEIAARREMLNKQKMDAAKAIDADAEEETKEVKKSKKEKRKSAASA